MRHSPVAYSSMLGMIAIESTIIWKERYAELNETALDIVYKGVRAKRGQSGQLCIFNYELYEHSHFEMMKMLWI